MPKRLGANKSSGSGNYTVYQVPTGKTAEVNISVFNNNAATATTYLYIAPTSTPANDYMIQNDKLSTVTGYERTGVILQAGEWLIFKTDVSGVEVIVYGIESDSSSDTAKQTALITTNTDTTVWTNGSSKSGSFDISVSVTEGATTDTAVVELYVTTTDVASGYLLQKETLSQLGTTGFSREGLALSTTDKLILRTNGISGQVATRLTGFTE